MSHNPEPIRRAPTRVSAAELARRQGVQPIKDVRDLALPGFFESDEELDEFIAFVYASRRAEIE